jgi:hypothetical protein
MLQAGGRIRANPATISPNSTFPAIMRQPTLQEIAAAAIRDIDVRNAKRMRRAKRMAQGTRPAPRRKIVRIEPTVPLAEAFKSWEHELINNPAPVEAPAPHKFYLKLFAAGIVLLVALGFGWAWVRESATWRNEERARQHEAFLLQGRALQAQIDKLTQHTERLEEKARILTQYSADLRYSFPGNDGSLLLKQVDQVLADRDRLLLEIENQRQRLAVVRSNMAELNAR